MVAGGELSTGSTDVARTLLTAAPAMGHQPTREVLLANACLPGDEQGVRQPIGRHRRRQCPTGVFMPEGGGAMVSPSGDEVDPDPDDETIWLARMVTEYTFAWEGRVKLTLEQTSEDRYNRTLLFAYEDVGNWDFFFVVNDIESDGIVTKGIFTKVVYHF